MASKYTVSDQEFEHLVSDALRRIGDMIPVTAEEVRCAEERLGSTPVDVPERLRDPMSALRQANLTVDVRQSETAGAFQALLRSLRLERRMSIDDVARTARIDVDELRRIESELGYSPKPRTIAQLAKLFGLPTKALARLANLLTERDSGFVEGAVRFAARSKGTSELSADERAELHRYVKFLSSHD